MPCTQLSAGSNSPRIRGDGPCHSSGFWSPMGFSPYSRGWSAKRRRQNRLKNILPVFAGMVPDFCALFFRPAVEFSPYSRGWSLPSGYTFRLPQILPVFAGMVPAPAIALSPSFDSPRIRGDGPRIAPKLNRECGFSPYSRGWSDVTAHLLAACAILPVFAGMVRVKDCSKLALSNSPRIRGDGPRARSSSTLPRKFSPYSRGWSPS